MKLYTYNDGSILKTLSAKELISIPVWNGNRILDIEHAEKIRESVKNNVKQLDSNFSLIKYTDMTTDNKPIEQTFLIDGQHRAYVIREYYNNNLCEDDFILTVREKTVESESDAVEYFNTINNVKKQQWKTDPNLLVNKYLVALEKHYNKSKKNSMIRPNANRPYLSSEKLREVLKKHNTLLKSSNDNVIQFVNAVNKENLIGVQQLTVSSAMDKNCPQYIERAIELKFSLAVNKELLWVQKILKSL